MSRIVRIVVVTLISIAASGLLTVAAEGSSSTGRIHLGHVALEIDGTGRLVRPTPDQAARLRQTFQQMFHVARSGSHEVVVTPGGLSSLVLDERYTILLFAQLDEEGRVSTECITGAETAVSQMAGAAMARTGDEE